ncbi:electron transfer flavoprotein-ubiquinone oxidoreductase [Microbacter margulisiae]|uniref:Electron transfer flavoprotein-ubiquinone oxidoreductase n=1 Tax=Microbacter margulisiae TaxID=1350067 RepID=A0A7W5DTT4_9PORP|nr:electron-transfer flavoprotein:ubiquinone oxidoreductase [Microbacter margulisiae]MBB3188565.1 electron-transferring-flavoprotein dehydrogenase [Microbacter margulisiae]
MNPIDIVNTDVLIIGGGPSGLATSIHLADLLQQKGIKKRILLIEKGNSIGSHILSGAVIKTDVFRDLLPSVDFEEIPFNAKVTHDATVWLNKNSTIKMPVHVPFMNNKGNYTVSLGQLCRYLAKKAEEKGVEIYPGFSVSEILYQNGQVAGAKTIDTGVDHHGTPMENFQPGTQIEAKLIIFAEGTRGSLAKQLIQKFDLDKGKNGQIYSLGCKELWSVPEGNIKPGEVYHTMGYPLNMHEFGGGFIYGLKDNKVAVGLVVGLDYQDPTFDVHHAFQIWKTNPFVAKFLKGGKLVEYGAKTLPEGGYYSIPKLYTDHALIVGDSAGFLAMPALKGVHLAITSGMMAAKTATEALIKNDFSEVTLFQYESLIQNSLIYKELYPVRNFRQGFSKGLICGGFHFATQLITGGSGFVGKLKTHPDSTMTKKLNEFSGKTFQERFKKQFDFDKILTFDKVTDVYYTGVFHDELQVPHVKINNPESFQEINIKQYGAPCQHFCSAEVYELHTDKAGHQEIRIHAENCLHCKTCDIKTPGDGITWSVPNGGNGPDFQNM